MSATYTGKFRCDGCGTHDFYCRFRDRGEDIVQWMDTAVRPSISDRHRVVSPFCDCDKADIMLPITEAADSIGYRVVQ